MSADDKKEDKFAQARKAQARAALMSSERPLDALLPELTSQAPRLPRTALHTRVLDVDRGDGYEWIIGMFADPGSLQKLHEQVRDLVEATFLAELSRVPSAGENLGRERAGLNLLSFAHVQGDMEQAIRAFGFQRGDLPGGGDDQWIETMRSEGIANGFALPEEPVSFWHAPAKLPADGGAAELLSLQAEMQSRMGDDVWGRTPGGPSRLLANLVEDLSSTSISPDLDGLRAFESLLVQADAKGIIRWIPPVLFQALCDFVGVVITSQFGHNVEWSDCTPDAGDYGPPPVFRITRDGTGAQSHLEIGLHLLRWCVMPILEGEDIPSLADWVDYEFGAGLN